MTEADLQPPKPLWHEDTRGQRNHSRGANHNGGYNPPAGPLSDGAHRMLQHSINVRRSRLLCHPAVPPSGPGSSPVKLERTQRRMNALASVSSSASCLSAFLQRLALAHVQGCFAVQVDSHAPDVPQEALVAVGGPWCETVFICSPDFLVGVASTLQAGRPLQQPAYYPAPAGPPGAGYGQAYPPPPGYAAVPPANGGYGQAYPQPTAYGYAASNSACVNTQPREAAVSHSLWSR